MVDACRQQPRDVQEGEGVVTADMNWLCIREYNVHVLCTLLPATMVLWGGGHAPPIKHTHTKNMNRNTHIHQRANFLGPCC